ncbi:MAG: RHS repeat protein, partial [Anaerolineae bacterium]|nr:RHS repeat protein [Anaerolineae bacterium]
TARTLPDGVTWSYAWDGNGNLTMLAEPDGSTQHVFIYTLDDRLGLYRSPLGAEERFTYDLDGRLVRRELPSMDAIEWHYNDQGQLTTLCTPEGQHTFGYDGTGLLIHTLSRDDQQVNYAYDGSLLTGTGWSGLVTDTVGYVYNDDLRVSQMDYAGTRLPMSYDGDGFLTGVGSITLRGDTGNGLLQSVVDGTFGVMYGYNTYGELSAVTATHGSTLYQVAYARDALGRITQKVETLGGNVHTWTYSYDVTGKLTTVWQDGTVVESYTYDAVGNRTAMSNTLTGVTVQSGDYSYDADHKLLAAGDIRYSYDANGRLHTVSDSDAATYIYNTDGTLASVQTGGQTISYQYDARGRRVARSVDGNRTHAWLYGEGAMPLAEYDGSGNLRSVFVYAGASTPVKMVRDGTIYHIISDHLGSVRLVVDENGVVVKQVDYDSFGNVISDTDPNFALPFGFAGGMGDPAHELVRFGARDYQPSTGRWTAKDPILFDGGHHLYGYVGKDPVNHTDRTGLQGAIEFVIILALIFTAGILAAVLFGNRICAFFQSVQRLQPTPQPVALDMQPSYFDSPPGVATEPTRVGQQVPTDGSVSFTMSGQDIAVPSQALSNLCQVSDAVGGSG